MEIVFAGPISDALALQRVLGEQGVHVLTIAVMFTRTENAGEVRRVADSMEGGTVGNGGSASGSVNLSTPRAACAASQRM